MKAIICKLRIAFLFCYSCLVPLLAYDFLLEFDLVYKLDESDIIRINDNLEINELKKEPFLKKKIIINENGMIVINNNLNFYYQNKRMKDNKENEIELRKINKKYVANNKYLRSYSNCFLIIKAMNAKKILTKDKSILLNLDELEALGTTKSYLKCIENKSHIINEF